MNDSPIMFNRKILNKYLSEFNSDSVINYQQKYNEMLKWKQSIKEEDIQKTKETSVQGKFFESVFEKVLGYATFLDGGEWNQIEQLKSKLDGTEADGALGFFTSKSKKDVRVVIELKDANTHLDKKQNRSNHLTPVEQAFSYAYKNGTSCGWVIVSNFREIRLYKSSSALEYEKILLTDLDNKDEFKRFYYLLNKENLIDKTEKSVIDRLYVDNEQIGIDISNQFYSDYKELRNNLFQVIKNNNTCIEEMVLLAKSQKILDRFIFICFCENKGLLPKDIFKSVMEAANKSFTFTSNRIWSQLNGLFQSIDQGNPPMNINCYNGGLFKKDDILDSLVIPDETLIKFTKLANCNFESELNVNILGHIFEQSISDLEQLKAEISGENFEKKSSKQKADGIYYTPNYVTKFIVEKTVGRWLNDAKIQIKQELLSNNGFVTSVGKRKMVVKKWKKIPENTNGEGKLIREAIIKLHIAFWEQYTEKLKAVRVLDPACGSGAFLNQVFDFLCEEGIYALEMQSSLLDNQITLFDWDKHILQNNLFGVDLNTESVEITKLSLWLKTARKDRTLASLDNNIKCGNSIISSFEISGEQAFDWNKEFCSVMEQGGFDIVVGNPPYGAKLSQAEKDYITENYKTTEYNFDTYKTFMELGLKLTKQNGYMGYITPSTYFILEKGATKLRKVLFDEYTLLDIVELFNVFETAVVEPAISIFKNDKPSNNETFEVISVPRKTILSSTFMNDGVTRKFKQFNLKEKEGYIFNFRETENDKYIIDKIREISNPLSKYFKVTTGVKPYQKGKGVPSQTKEVLDSKPFDGYEKKDDTWIPYTRGRTINRYVDAWDGEYIKYGKWLAEPRNSEIFKNEKIFIRQTGDYPIATYDVSGKIGKNTIHCIYALENDKKISLKYVLGLINSSLIKWIFQHDNFHIVGKPLAETKKIYVERLPIVVSDNQETIVYFVDQLLEKSQLRFHKAKQFIEYVNMIYNPKSITERLSLFYKINFKAFIDELKSQRVRAEKQHA